MYEGISSTVTSFVKRVRKGEFAKKVAIECGRELLIGTRVESYLAISVKQEGTSHCPIGDDIYPCRKRRGRRTVVVKLNGHSGMPACTE